MQTIPLPKFYTFPSVDARERILYANFERVNQDVKDMILEIQMEFKKEKALACYYSRSGITIIVYIVLR